MHQKINDKLLQNSIAASLSAIEIYNKPHFPYRNEVFCILIINAWELLFKAKILTDNNDDVTSIYVYDNKGLLKTNRNAAPLTIEIYGAMSKLGISEIVQKNISSLIDMRDTSSHFISNQPLDYLVYSLGAACLRNYQKYIKEWFKRDLMEYNFYIMPLGFSHNFKSFKMIDLDKEPEEIRRLINIISENQKAQSNDGFYFNCEIQINLVSAKKITDSTDLVVSINPNATEYVIVEKPQKLIDKYRLSFNELWLTVKKELPELKQHEFLQYLKDRRIKEDEKFAGFNFRYKRHEDVYLKTGKIANGTACLYNEECVKHILMELPKFLQKRREAAHST